MSDLSFTFKRVSDQTEVPTNEVDRQVCEAFGLTYDNPNDAGHPDYGHFSLDKSTYGQDYIRGMVSYPLFYGGEMCLPVHILCQTF